MRTHLIILTIVLAMPMAANSDEYSKHVDESLRKMDLEIDKTCKDISNIGQEMKCRKSVRERQEATGNRRGTDEYCKKHYLSLNNSALEDKYKELSKLRRAARGVGDPNPRNKGEMAQTTYAVEVGCIARELERRGVRK